jgi:hypothetical protein
MSKEIVKNEGRIYYSRLARAYYVTIGNCTHYFASRKAAEAYLEKDTCPDCVWWQQEYESYRCPAHYDFDEDNARAIEQTGYGISGSLTKEERRIWSSHANEHRRTPNTGEQN